jgi:hypothetical protein
MNTDKHRLKADKERDKKTSVPVFIIFYRCLSAVVGVHRW